MVKIVAMLERSDGNAETGTAWTETAIFNEDQRIRDIVNWAIARTRRDEPTRRGRLSIDIADARDE